jgi:hypothetical protein
MIKIKPKIIVTVILALLLLSPAIYFYVKYQNSLKLIDQIKTPNPNVVDEKKAAIIKEVSKIIELPADEDPVVATITDVEKLKNQLFFTKAKNGYEVLVYMNAKRAYLYDPSAHKIIEVAVVNAGPNTTPDTNVSTQSAVVNQTKVVLWNGTATPGLTNAVNQKITANHPDVAITGRGNAKNNTYTENIIVVLNAKAQNLAQALATELGAKIAELPADETAPANTDLLLIVGKSQ